MDKLKPRGKEIIVSMIATVAIITSLMAFILPSGTQALTSNNEETSGGNWSVVLNGSPTTIPQGQSTNMTWVIQENGVDHPVRHGYCIRYGYPTGGWSGYAATVGSQSVSFNSAGTYNLHLACYLGFTGSGMNQYLGTDTVTITVT